MRFPRNALRLSRRAFLYSRQKAEGRRQTKCAGRRLLPLFILYSSFSILTSGCRVDPPADLVIINGTEPETLDPAIMTGVSEMRIAPALFEGLTRNDPRTAAPIPGLAESWDVSAAGRLYTFHLRSNAVWSTGEPITAADVVYSWLRALDPVTGADYAGQFFYLKGGEDFYNRKIKDPSQVGIHAMNARTVQVELNHPAPFFLDLCALPAYAVMPRQVIEKYGDRWLKAQPLPVSGPYELACWRVNDKVRLRKNPRYWDAAHTQTEVIDILPVGSPGTALNLYQTGAADVIWDKDLVPVELLDLLVKRPDCHTFRYLGTYFIRFNVTQPPFDDMRVRKALALAIDKRRIVEKITKAGEKTASHLTPDGVANYDPPVGLGYDPAEARRLLAEAGYPGGKGFPRFQYTFDVSAVGAAKLNGKIAVELQQMWRDALGIEMELRQMERKIFFSAQSRLDYQVSRSSWVADYNDANTFLDIFLSDSGNNRTGWKNARYDELIHEANAQTDPQMRAALFREAETILVEEEVPIVPLYFYTGVNFYDPRKISGIYPNILDLHPLNAIRKLGRGSRVEGQTALALRRSLNSPRQWETKERTEQMKTRFRFEKLEVWQEARAINRSIYILTRKFPNRELFAMTSQIRRASISDSSNIAEGSGRNSDKDFAHFLEQAYGSLMEVASVFFLALDEGYVTETDLDPLFDGIERLAKRIATLNRSLQIKSSKTPFTRRPRP